MQIPGSYVTPTPTAVNLTSYDDMLIYTSPDYARTQLFYDIGNTTKTFNIMIYQVG